MNHPFSISCFKSIALDIDSLLPEVHNTFNKKQIFRTETEMRISVLNDIYFPTSASKYWQAVREQSNMFESLVILGFDYRRNENTLKKLFKKLEKTTEELDREEIQIDIDEALFKHANITNVAKDRTREIVLWSKIKKELDDGSFDTENVDNHQLLSYTKRFSKELSKLPPNISTAEAGNLFGQFESAVKLCEKNSILSEALADLPPEISAGIKREYIRE